MRIRSTKPEFWRSQRIAAVDWDARLVLKGLESYVDDNGVGKDDIALIVGDIFSRDMLASPSETVARVSEAISSLHERGLVWRYEVDGTDLIYISWWESIQRIDKPGKGRLERPDGTMEYGDSQIRESVASPRESVAPGTGEQGNRGTGEQTPLSAAAASADKAPRFDEFWDAYDHKVKRVDAEKAWAKAIRKADPEFIIARAAAYVASIHADREARGERATAQAHAASWLNGERWDDDLPTNVRQLRTDDQGRPVLPPLPSRSPWGN